MKYIGNGSAVLYLEHWNTGVLLCLGHWEHKCAAVSRTLGT